jgi:hypothetical protein
LAQSKQTTKIKPFPEIFLEVSGALLVTIFFYKMNNENEHFVLSKAHYAANKSIFFLILRNVKHVFKNILLIYSEHVKCITTEESSAKCAVMCHEACKQSSLLTSIQNTYPL